MPYAGGYFQLQFGHADVIDKLVRPELDAIIASVQIDDTAGPPPEDDTKSDGAARPRAVPKNSI